MTQGVDEGKVKWFDRPIPTVYVRYRVREGHWARSGRQVGVGDLKLFDRNEPNHW